MTMYNLQEAATAYAKAAKRVLGKDADYLNNNQELVPVFVALLFQSIEISLKHLGIEAALFTENEARDRKLTKNGHGVREIANLVNTKLGANKDYPVVNALTAGLNDGIEARILKEMLFGDKFKATRRSYKYRNLGYAQLNPGDYAMVVGVDPWAAAVRNVAENLPNAVAVVKQWKLSPSNSSTFIIWINSG